MLLSTISVVFYGQDDSFILLSNYSPIWEKLTAFPKSFYFVEFFICNYNLRYKCYAFL